MEPRTPEAELSNADILRELVDYFGWRRAARIVGLCVLLDTLGSDAMVVAQGRESGGRGDRDHGRRRGRGRDEEREERPGRVTYWRALRDIRRFREHLMRREEEQPDDVRYLMERIGRIARAG